MIFLISDLDKSLNCPPAAFAEGIDSNFVKSKYSQMTQQKLDQISLFFKGWPQLELYFIEMTEHTFLYKFLPPRGFDPWTLGTVSRLIDE